MNGPPPPQEPGFHPGDDPFNPDVACKENGHEAHLLWILVFDNQHNQI